MQHPTTMQQQQLNNNTNTNTTIYNNMQHPTTIQQFTTMNATKKNLWNENESLCALNKTNLQEHGVSVRRFDFGNGH